MVGSLVERRDVRPLGASLAQALLEKYKIKEADLHYFQVHEEADLHEHLDGLDGARSGCPHDFERLLQDGNTWYRPGWGPEYCCLTNAEYVALFHEGIYKHSRALAHF